MYAVPVVDPVDQCNLILPSQENSSFASLGQSFGWSGSVFENIILMLEILKFRSSSHFHVTIWMARELKRILYRIKSASSNCVGVELVGKCANRLTTLANWLSNKLGYSRKNKVDTCNHV